MMTIVRQACALLLAACGSSVEPPARVAIEPTPAMDARRNSEPAPGEAPTLVGRWQGIGKQLSGPTWPMTLDITSLGTGECARVDYPSIGCGGHWECSQASDGFVLEAVEVITYGHGLCIDHVPVIVRLARDRQSISFAVAAGADSAEANLQRAP